MTHLFDSWWCILPLIMTHPSCWIGLRQICQIWKTGDKQGPPMKQLCAKFYTASFCHQHLWQVPCNCLWITTYQKLWSSAPRRLRELEISGDCSKVSIKKILLSTLVTSPFILVKPCETLWNSICHSYKVAWEWAYPVLCHKEVHTVKFVESFPVRSEREGERERESKSE